MKLRYLRASLLIGIFHNYPVNSMVKIDIDNYAYLSDSRIISLFDAVIYDYMISQENNLSLNLNNFDEITRKYAEHLEKNFELSRICSRFTGLFKSVLKRIPEIGLNYLKDKIKSKVHKINSKEIFRQEILNKEPLVRVLRNINWDDIKIENFQEIFNLIDINQRDYNGWTVLMYASYYGYIDVVDILLDLGANINEKSKLEDTALQLAISQEHKKIVDLLINKSIPQN